MQIPWNTINGHNFPGVTVISAKQWPMVCVALGGPESVVNAPMHYVPTLERSVPHMLCGCHHCEYPITPKWWFPVLLSPVSYQRNVMTLEHPQSIPDELPLFCTWKQKVCEMPESGSKIVDQLERGMTFAFCRGEGRQHKKVIWRRFSGLMNVGTPSFDVRPHLLKAWGLVNMAEFSGQNEKNRRAHGK